MLRFNLTTTEKTTMKYKLVNLELPCKLVLDDYQGFLDYAKAQGKDNLTMAKQIADQGFVRCYSLGYSKTGVELVSTDLTFNGDEIGLDADELQFFTLHSAGF